MNVLLKIILALLISTQAECSMATSQTSAGTIMINDNGDINCDGLICPESVVNCYIEQAAVKGTKKMTTTRICTDETGLVLAKNETIGPSPHPGYSAYAHADIHGSFTSSTNGVTLNSEENKRLQEKIKNETSKVVEETNAMVKNIQTSVQESVSKTLNSVNTMFRSIFG